jgi:hypothetical protein
MNFLAKGHMNTTSLPFCYGLLTDVRNSAATCSAASSCKPATTCE